MLSAGSKADRVAEGFLGETCRDFPPCLERNGTEEETLNDSLLLLFAPFHSTSAKGGPK